MARQRDRLAANLSRCAGGATVAIGLLATFGWALNSDALRSFGRGYPAMKFNSALVCILCGSALLVDYRNRSRRALPVMLAASAGLLAFLTLAEYAFGVNFGIDQLLVSDRTGGRFPPGRMAPLTALLLLFSALALVLAYGKRLFRLPQILAMAGIFISWLSFVHYVYGAIWGGRFEPVGLMAIHTVIAGSLLNLGVLCLDERRGLVGVLQMPGLSGLIARRLFPTAVFVPLALGWLRLEGQHLGFYGTELGLAILTTSTIMILIIYIWWSAASVASLEAARALTGTQLASQGRLLLLQSNALKLQANLIDHSNDAIITMDAIRHIVSWNRGAEKLYGWTSEEAAGKVIHEFLRTKCPISIADMDRILDEAGRWDGELIHTCKSGKIVTVDSRQTRLRDEERNTTGIVEINRDITGAKALEEQLRQTQKLESVGQLAAGIAHDFNNVLTVIGGYAHMLTLEESLSDDVRDSAQEILRGAERAEAITRQLLAFSRRQISVKRNVVLNEIVSGVEKMLRRAAGEHIDVALWLNREATVVYVDPGYIEQAIMNLVINARDAMPEGGRIVIETERFYVDQEYAATHVGVVEGPYVSLSISDTGTGMSPEVKAQIFEPFFTTKEVGRGTGLGLSTVYGIVKQSRGEIVVYSEVGRGTTFKILLPAAEGPVSRLESDAASLSTHGTETILLAEDEESLRTYIGRILQRNGYQVLVAVNGHEALEIAARDAGTISMLLTDVIMPELGGHELADQFSRLYPEIAVLHMSGYTNRLGKLDSTANFIQKPFTASALLAQIRGILDSRTTP